MPARAKDSIEDLVRNFRSSAQERVFRGQWGETHQETKIGHVRIGRICRITRQLPEISREGIEPDQIKREQSKLNNAINNTLFEIETIREESEKPDQPVEISAHLPQMMQTHAMFAESFRKKILTKIENDRMSADEATVTVRDAEIKRIKGGSNEKNMEDYEAVVDLILRKIKLEEGEEYGRSSLANIPYGCMIIADELSPSDGVYLQSKGVRGIICAKGSPNGHVATIAKELGIPCLFGVDNLGATHDDMPVIVDTQKGEAILNPSEARIRSYNDAVDLANKKDQKRKQYHKKKIKTADNVPVNVYSNIGFTATADRANKNRADGIGLYRTELLLTNWSSEPSLDIQRHAYRYVMNALDGNAVTIRLLDNEGDKAEGKWIRNADRWAVMENQVEAILCASADTGVAAHILLPVVRDREELIRLRNIINEKTGNLKEKGLQFPAPKMGMMVEVVSTAMEIEDYIDLVDFLSGGTNDLAAWTLGQIRNEGLYAKFGDPLNRSLLKLIKNVAEVADEHKKPFSICGQIASYPAMAAVLLGIGIRKFSAGVEEVLDMKEALEKISTKDAELLVKDLLAEPDKAKRQQILHEFNEKRGIGQYVYKAAQNQTPDADAAPGVENS